MKIDESSQVAHFPFFAKAIVAKGNFKIIVLSVLLERPMHGYEILRYIEMQSKGLYKPSPGSIYPALRSLLGSGHVKVTKTDRRKTYQITATGKRFLQNRHDEVERTIKAYSESLGPERAALMQEVHKTMKLIAIASKDVSPEQALEMIKVCMDAREKMLRIVSK